MAALARFAACCSCPARKNPCAGWPDRPVHFAPDPAREKFRRPRKTAKDEASRRLGAGKLPGARRRRVRKLQQAAALGYDLSGVADALNIIATASMRPATPR